MSADVTIAPEAERVPSRTSQLYRIAELMIRYRPEMVGRAWKVRDGETGQLLAPVYTDEPMARAGARLTAACDIRALFDA